MYLDKIALLALVLLLPLSSAYGHGQGLDTISDIRVDGKKLTVTVEMPLSFEGGTEQITITATEDATKENAQNVTFLIGLFHDEKMIFRNYFFAQDGSLELEVTPTNNDIIAIHGVQDELLGAWSGNPIKITGPLLDSGGLYTFEIEIRTVDDPTNIIEDSGVYQADVSVADTYAFAGYEEFTLKSYFEKIDSFEHAAGVVTFDMPFDWSEKKITHIPVIHTEVRFPKSSEFNTPGYEGYVNGIKLFKASVSIDDYTREGERTVHFVLLQDHLRSIKKQIADDGLPDNMTFELRTGQVLEFPLSAFTRGDDFEVNLAWDPREIEPGVETDFIFTIRDGATGSPLRNSDYTFVILSNGQEIHRVSGTAQIGGDFERYTFAEDQTGPIIIRFENIRNTGLETEFGIVVVPEFGAIALLVLGVSLLGATYVLSRAPRALPYPCSC
ncbi:MAG: PEFG-CTERM sorting domain-containing protein [Nitrosopumilus sp. B06]|nr:MAG: PEFG-CTERM sorting domain-containing protein [Nitrosopumilus sp. B06]